MFLTVINHTPREVQVIGTEAVQSGFYKPCKLTVHANKCHLMPSCKLFTEGVSYCISGISYLSLVIIFSSLIGLGKPSKEEKCNGVIIIMERCVGI